MITTSLPLAFFVLMGQTPMELFKHGGPVMWPVLILSFLTVTVAIERILFIVRESASREPEVVAKMLERVEARDVEGAIELGKKSKDFVARILIYALTHRETSMQNAFTRAANQELTRYSTGMATLDTCITAAPLIGLLGTVTGMMNTFGALGTGDIAQAAGAITGGVAEGLIATAAGLAIAITGLIPFNYLNSKTEEAKHDVSDAWNALEILTKKTTAGV
jgi:biopolymer transport protein ExbB